MVCAHTPQTSIENLASAETAWLLNTRYCVVVKYASVLCSSCRDEVGKKTLRVAIVGGGPAGLLTAIMLAKMGYSGIEVFEKREKPAAPSDKIWSDVDSPEFKRSYNIGIGGRGQRVLSKFSTRRSCLMLA